MEKIITCKNCNNQFEGNFCNRCRQGADTRRISWHEILHQLHHGVTHTDKGLLFTLKQMAVRPGHAIREYVSGKRIDHFNPFLFILILAGIAVYFFEAAHVRLLNKAIDLEAIESYNSLVAHKFFLIPALILMILLVITDFFFYRSWKYVIPELIISNIFQLGQLLALVIITFPLLFLQQIIEFNYGWHITLRPFIKGLMVFYLFFVRYQLYNAKGNYWLMIKIIVQLIFIFVLYDFVVEPLIARFFS